MERGIILPKPKRTRYIKRRPKTVYLPRICQIVQNQGLQHISASIFACLDIKTLLDCKSVCKIWRKFFENPWFWFKMCVQNNMPEVHQTEWKQLIENFQKSNREIILSKYLIKTITGVKPEKHYELEFHGHFQSPLTLACKYGELSILKALQSMNTLKKAMKTADAEIGVVMNKVYPQALENYGTCYTEEFYFPCHVAAENGQLEIVKILCSTYDDDIGYLSGNNNDQNMFHFATLDYAVSGNHHDLVKHLIDEEFLHQYECKNWNNSENIFHRAARYSDANMLKMLLDNFDINDDYSKYHDYCAIINIACEVGKLETVKVAIDWIVEIYHPKDLNYLDQVGLDLDQVVSDFSPLHYAACYGHFKIVKYLISKGANPDVIEECGGTPICFAAGNGHFEIVKYLCGLMKKPHLADDFDNNPIHFALMKGDHFRYGEKKKPLHLTKGHIEIVKFLANVFDNPNAKNEKGQTPLSLSLECDNGLEVVPFIIQKQFKDKNNYWKL